MDAPERLRYEDVEGLRVGRFGRRVNTTCILWRIGDTLIDTGPPNQWRRVRQFAREQPVRRVVVTHHHEDHAGNLARLESGDGVEILAPRLSLGPLANGFPLKLYQRVIWGRPPRVRAAPLPETLELGEGGRLESVLLPGHSPDMTCLLERRRRVLFSADLYVARRQRYLRADENLGGILASLRVALELDFDTLLCSHRGVVEDGKDHLRQRLEYFEELVSRLHYSKRNLIRGCLVVQNAGRPACDD
jgi:glyoxylase-like metal-dependent hydrolase (beta-lactamase superfamily II)